MITISSRYSHMKAADSQKTFHSDCNLSSAGPSEVVWLCPIVLVASLWFSRIHVLTYGRGSHRATGGPVIDMNINEDRSILYISYWALMPEPLSLGPRA